jgi:Flp pilus assembly protein TadB
MTTPSSSYRSRGSLFRPAGPGPDMRVSDSERTEVADRLSKHYSDGRLDETEFNERLDQAMSAKTQSDLRGLLADLPGSGPPPRRPPRPGRQRGSLGRILLLALLVVVAVGVGQALLHMYLLWILVALGAFVWLRYNNRHHR